MRLNIPEHPSLIRIKKVICLNFDFFLKNENQTWKIKLFSCFCLISLLIMSLIFFFVFFSVQPWVQTCRDLWCQELFLVQNNLDLEILCLWKRHWSLEKEKALIFGKGFILWKRYDESQPERRGKAFLKAICWWWNTFQGAGGGNGNPQGLGSIWGDIKK